MSDVQKGERTTVHVLTGGVTSAKFWQRLVDSFCHPV